MPITRAAQPTRKIFDAWNSSATGHQRADNRLSGSTAWRDSRTAKLHAQLADAASAGHGGGEQRVYDTVGAGSEFFGRDGRRENGSWEVGASGLRGNGQLDIKQFWGVGKSGEGRERVVKRRRAEGVSCCNEEEDEEEEGLADATEGGEEQSAPRQRQIFANLTFYVNGSTYPAISDHKLKHLLGQHGGSLALGLARRRVTHVILGHAASTAGSKGAGGGLAARKLQKEISSSLSGRGGVNAGIRYVSAEWVLECIRVGKRVAEWSDGASAPPGVGSGPRQASVLSMFEKKAP